MFLPAGTAGTLFNLLRSDAPWIPWHTAERYQNFVDTVIPSLKDIEKVPASTDVQTVKSQLDSLIKHLESYLSCAVWGVTYAYVLVPLASTLIKKWIRPEWRNQVLSAWLSGLPNDKNFEVSREIGDLSDCLRQILDSEEQSKIKSSSALLEKLESNTDAQLFLDKFDAFIKQHGHRTTERDIFYPRWSEQTDIPLGMIVGQLNQTASTPEHSPETDTNKRDLPKSIFEPAGFRLHFRRAALKRILSLARSLLPVRENMRYYGDMFLLAIRKLFLAHAENLVKVGKLSFAEQIFFLTRNECFDPQADWSMLSSLSKERQRQFEANHHRRLPDYLKNGQDLSVEETQYDPGDGLSGTAASAGIAQGQARVLRNTEDFLAVKKGDILVAEMLDPSWSSLIPICSGIVTEVGGQLSHGAIIAREYGVPAVVGIRDACNRFSTGTTLIVDGNAGKVIERV